MEPYNPEEECTICLRVKRVPVTLTCRHQFCDLCIRTAIRAKSDGGLGLHVECPICRDPITDDKIADWEYNVVYCWDSKGRGRNTQYKVQWEDNSKSWIGSDQYWTCHRVIDEFRARRKKESDRRRYLAKK